MNRQYCGDGWGWNGSSAGTGGVKTEEKLDRLRRDKNEICRDVCNFCPGAGLYKVMLVVCAVVVKPRRGLIQLRR